MDHDKKPPLTMQVGGLDVESPELSLAEQIPSVASAGEALWAALPQLPTVPMEMVGALSEVLPHLDHDQEREMG